MAPTDDVEAAGALVILFLAMVGLKCEMAKNRRRNEQTVHGTTSFVRANAFRA